MEQLFIGMTDVLLGDPENGELIGRVKRDRVTVRRTREIHGDHNLKHLSIHVEWLGFECKSASLSCFWKFFNETDGSVIRDHRRKPDAVFINVMVHLMKNATAVANLIQEAKVTFRSKSHIPNLTWVTGNSHKGNLDKRVAETEDAYDRAEREIYEITKEFKAPLIDISSVTRSCNWTNLLSYPKF